MRNDRFSFFSGVVIFAILMVAAGGYFAFKNYLNTQEIYPPDENSTESSLINVISPKSEELISSPLNIKGITKPGWVVFEAQAGTATLYDENGNKLGFAILRATGEWMKPEVEFEGSLVFSAPKTATGKLVFKDDNPKDESEAKTFEMPVRFASFSPETRKINLFYYNKIKDQEMGDYVPCGREAVLAVPREIPLTMTPIQDAVNLLLQGALSDEEKLAGFQTEFPLGGFKLIGANMVSGALTLKFDDPETRSGGGSCRASLLWGQISKTALQFPEVKEVRFEPETLFQP